MSRTRCAGRFAAPPVLAAAALAGLSCAGAPADPSGPIHDFEMRERVAAVEVGQRADAARAILGTSPVRRPGHPDDPFPSPRGVSMLATPDGVSVRVEAYVVATRSAEGCPDVHYEDVPVVFVDGVVAGKGWAWVERRWRAWGGALEALREAQDRRRCPAPMELRAEP